MGSPKVVQRPVAHYAALAVLLLCAAYQTRVTIDIVAGTLPPRAPIFTSTASRIITSVYPEAAKAGILQGAELVAVDGREFRGASVLAGALRARQPEETINLTVRRDGQTITVPVRLAAGAIPLGRLEVKLLTAVMYVAMPWFCLLLGFGVAAIRPRDPQAWLLLALMLSFPHIIWVGIMHWGDFARIFGLIYQQVMRGMLPAMMLLFGLYFAERARLDVRWPWIKWLLLVPIAFAAAVNLAANLLLSENLDLAGIVIRRVQPLAPALTTILFIAIGSFFALIGYKSGTSRNPDAKRRLRMLLWGTQAAMTAMFALILASLFTNKEVVDLVPGWVLTAALLLMFLFPLTMAYVVVVHRALDVRVVLRQGIQYALARGGAQVLMVALGTLILFASISYALDSGANRPRQITMVAAGVMLLMLLQRARVALAGWIDRRFFRQAYDA